MIKAIYIAVSSLVVFIVTLFNAPDQRVTITQSGIPAMISTGQHFTVEVRIGKGNVDGFAQFVQPLSEGFTITPLNIGEAKLSVEGQLAKFTWFALPGEKEITLTYEINAGVMVPGEKDLTGTFSYIYNDKTAKADANPAMIKVITEAETMMTANAIEINRSMPEKIAKGEGFDVKLTVKNSTVHAAAKLVEHIPEGWAATVVETAGAVFKAEDNMVKFIWLQLPADTEFTVSYHVMPDPYSVVQNIYGTFSFDDNGLARSFDYFPSQVYITTPDPVAAAIKEGIAKKEKKDAPVMAVATNVPAPENGIVYKVQIAATRKSVSDMSLFNTKYHVSENVSTDMHEGWYKYSIGSFNEYRAAKGLRAATTEKVSGAFVIAYNNGERITVREALTVSGQKWIQ